VKRRALIRSSVFLVVAFAAACGDVEDDGPDEHPPFVPAPIPERSLSLPATALSCANGSDLTYENFGSGFLAGYCIVCHSSTSKGDQRGGAPEGVDFDGPDNARLWRAEMYTHTVGTPSKNNKTGKTTLTGSDMPPSGNVPADEKALFAEWLNCGAPAGAR
jgi:hypothetical protein